VYAVCVVWPFNLDPWIGWTAGGLIILISLIQFIAGLGKGRTTDNGGSR